VRPEAINVCGRLSGPMTCTRIWWGCHLIGKNERGEGLLVERKLRNAMIIDLHPFGYPAQIISPRIEPEVLGRGSR
jgi:hypothetical protein